VQGKLRQEGMADQVIMEAVQLLSRRCVYCEVTQERGAEALEAAEPHGYQECELAGVRCQYPFVR
jgi:hypothetical protein